MIFEALGTHKSIRYYYLYHGNVVYLLCPTFVFSVKYKQDVSLEITQYLPEITSMKFL